MRCRPGDRRSVVDGASRRRIHGRASLALLANGRFVRFGSGSPIPIRNSRSVLGLEICRPLGAVLGSHRLPALRSVLAARPEALPPELPRSTWCGSPAFHDLATARIVGGRSFLVIFVVWWLLPVTRLGAEDRRPDRCRLSVATFNARFLFDGLDPEGDASFPWKGDSVQAGEHLSDIARLLREVDADIVHVSEVESLEVLEWLVSEIGDDSYRAFLVPGFDLFTRQNVGVISRVDPVGAPFRTDEWARSPFGGPAQGVSKNYVARFELAGLDFALVGLHLLAFPYDPERAPRRESQAEVIRRLCVREGTERRRFLIVLGDFNDFDSRVPDAAGNTTRTRVLDVIRGVDGGTTRDELENVASTLPPDRRFSAFFDRDRDGFDDGITERSMTDHILLSSELAPAIELVEVFDEHDPIAGPSDHFPLKVTLDLTRLGLFTRGDADSDGTVDWRDSIAALEFLFGKTRLDCVDAADTDDDGRIRVTDAVRLLIHLFQRGPAPAPPGSVLPGHDPTDDSLECALRTCR